MRNILGLILGFALASSVVGCIYRLGYLHGEIAALDVDAASSPRRIKDVSIPSDAARCRVNDGEAAR